MRARSREGDLLAELTDVVDSAVAGRVHFDEVERIAGGDGFAGGAGIAGLAVDRAGAVHRAREDACGRGLSGATGPAEQVRMGQLAGRKRVANGGYDMVLADDLVEATWTPLPV